jgi:CubicO group peptidase (beta-lactamase class C family)
MTADQIGPGSGVAHNHFYYPGDRFGFGYGFGIHIIPATRYRRRGSLGEVKWDGATGVYIVVARAEDMFFVLMEDAPSGRMRVQVTLKKIIDEAFEK